MKKGIEFDTFVYNKLVFNEIIIFPTEKCVKKQGFYPLNLVFMMKYEVFYQIEH